MINGTARIVGREGPIILWEPRIELAVAGISLDFRTIEAVVDTGFTGSLALSSELAHELGLSFAGRREVYLAHGHQILNVYGAVVSWCGENRAVPVYQVDGVTLVGTALLTNCLLGIDFREGGEVSIRPHWLSTPE